MKWQVSCPTMPLAVYREVTAHLQQVDGVEVSLISQPSQQFDYYQSQVGSLWIQLAEEAPAFCRDRVEQILAYYGDRYGSWEQIDSPS